MIFCVTFPQWHPLRDNWIEIEAETEDKCRAAVVYMFGIRWGFIYEKSTHKPEFFPGGQAGRTINEEDGPGQQAPFNQSEYA
jgi:hypothetical protein